MVAVKIFRKKDMTFGQIDLANHERDYMNHMEHPNIMRPLDYFEDNDLMMINLQCMQFDLKTYMNCNADSRNFRREAVKPIFKQMLLAVDHCH